MRVDIKCLYYMLCYAWDALHIADQADVIAGGASSPQELLARMLASETERLLRRGMARGYRVVETESRYLRGKILGARTARLAARGPQILALSHDEFSRDILLNQILRSTIVRLAHSAEGVELGTKRTLAGLAAQLPEVATNHVQASSFRRVQLQSHNREYRTAMNLCEMIQRHLVPEPSTGTWRFRDFLGSDQEMGNLYIVPLAVTSAEI